MHYPSGANRRYPPLPNFVLGEQPPSKYSTCALLDTRFSHFGSELGFLMWMSSRCSQVGAYISDSCYCYANTLAILPCTSQAPSPDWYLHPCAESSTILACKRTGRSYCCAHSASSGHGSIMHTYGADVVYWASCFTAHAAHNSSFSMRLHFASVAVSSCPNICTTR